MQLSLIWLSLKYFSNRLHPELEKELKKASSSARVIVSEFPRNFFVSTVLLLFVMILLTLGIEIGIYVVNAAVLSKAPFNPKSLVYLAAYLLANGLFLAHILMYFGYRESVCIDSQKVDVKYQVFRMIRSKSIHRDQIFFFRTNQGWSGSYHLEIYYFDEMGNTCKVQFGSYLEDDDILALSRELDQLRYL